MKNLINLTILVVIAFFSIVNLNCNGKNNSDTIKIGATLDFTGPNAVYGEQVQQGINLAVEELNNKDGIINKKIQMIFLDSKSDPNLAISNAQKFINVEGIKILIGEISSNATQSMIPVVEQNGAFLFAPASSSPKLTNISKNFVRNWPSDLAEAGSAADYAILNLKSKNASIIYVNSDYGLGLKDKFTEIFISKGGTILNSEPYSIDANDFRSILLKIKNSNSECLYLAGNPKEMGRCIKQIREMGITTNVISNTGFLQNDCLSIAGNKADGVIIPTPEYNPQKGTSEIAVKFYNLFLQKYKTPPTMISANAYDCIYLIKEAIEKVGIDGNKIGEYLRNKKDFNGAAGLINFTNGDVEVPIVYKIIKNGKPENI